MAVARLAHRRGRNDREVIDLQRAGKRDETLQIGEGELDAVRVETSGPGDTASERAHDLFVEQRQQTGAEPFEHDKAQRVRTDIDDGDTPDGSGGVAIRHAARRSQRATSRAWPRRKALPRPERLGLVMK